MSEYLYSTQLLCLCDLSNCFIALQKLGLIPYTLFLAVPKLSEQQTDMSKGHCQVCHLCQKFSLSVLLFLERAAHLPDIHQTMLETLWHTLHTYTLVYGCNSMNKKGCHSLKSCSWAKLFSLKNLHLVACSNLFSGKSLTDLWVHWNSTQLVLPVEITKPRSQSHYAIHLASQCHKGDLVLNL